MKRLTSASVLGLLLLANHVFAQETSGVQVTIKVPSKLASFQNQRLVLTLYHNYPQIADKGPKTVDSYIDKAFSHETGKETTATITLGDKAKLNTRVQYFVTLYLFDAASKRTYIGERDGEGSTCNVLTNGSPSKVVLVVRPLEKK